MAVCFTIFTPTQSVQSYEMTLAMDEIKVGRAPYCHLQLPFETISSHHFSVIDDGGRYFIFDAGSTNGTVINGKKLQPGHFVPVGEDDLVRLADIEIRVQLLADDASSLTLEESHGISRQMLSDVLHESETEDTMASLGVVEGPKIGLRVNLPEDRERSIIGSGSESLLQLPGPEVMEEHAIILKQHDHFAIQPASPDARVVLNGMPLEREAKLKSNNELRIGPHVVVFNDPLERQLQIVPQDDIDDDDDITRRVPRAVLDPLDAESQPTLSLGPADRPPDLPLVRFDVARSQYAEKSSWGLFEILLLVTSTLLFLGGVALLLILFDVISLEM